MAAASEDVLEPIRDGAEFTPYRARQRGNPVPLLLVASTGEPRPQKGRMMREMKTALPESFGVHRFVRNGGSHDEKRN